MNTPHKPRHAAPAVPPESAEPDHSAADPAESGHGAADPVTPEPAASDPARADARTAQFSAVQPASPWQASPASASPASAEASMWPDAADTGRWNPAAVQSDGVQFGAVQSDGVQFGAVQSDGPQSGVAQSGALQSDGAQSDGAPPGVAQSDEAPPGVAQSDGAQREVPQPKSVRAARSGPSVLRLVWVYPDLLSTYGDRGNLLVLERRARLRGIEVESLEVKSDERVPQQGDIYLMGGGEDLPQILAARRLRADAGLAAAANRGGVLFAVCAGYQVLGAEFGGVEGEPVAGLGILDISSGRGQQRGVGEIVADVVPELGIPPLTGFENHQGVTSVGPGARPLARVTVGVGNGDGTEGAYAGKVLGTYLHGPALVRNPDLADLLLTWAAGPLEPLSGADEEWARLLREERLAAVAS